MDGRYSTLGQEITMLRLAKKMAGIVHRRFGDTKLRVQFMHGKNAAGAEMLKGAVQDVLDIVEDKLVPVTLVLGAHAGPTVFGLAAIPQSIFDSLYH